MADALPWPDLDPIPAGWLDDTPPSVVARLRAATPQRRAATAHLLWRTARAALLAAERARAPDASEAEVARRARTRLAGAGLAQDRGA